MWSSPDVVGLFSNNVVSFSRNVVLRDHLFSVNLVSKPRMLSVRTVYVLSSLQLAVKSVFIGPRFLALRFSRRIERKGSRVPGVFQRTLSRRFVRLGRAAAQSHV